MHDDKRGAAAPRFFATDPVLLAIQRAAAVLGLLCAVAGAGVALYTVWLVFSLISDPQSVPWIGSLLGQGAGEVQALRGTVDGRPFDLAMGRELYLAGLLFLGVLLLWAIAGLAKALISAGIRLIAGISSLRQLAE